MHQAPVLPRRCLVRPYPHNTRCALVRLDLPDHREQFRRCAANSSRWDNGANRVRTGEIVLFREIQDSTLVSQIVLKGPQKANAVRGDPQLAVLWNQTLDGDK